MNMKDELKAFVDNELNEADRTRILKELDNNPELQAEVIELRQMSRVIREEAWQPEPVGLERTLRALEASKTKKPWWMTGPLQLVAGAACVAIVIAVFFPVFAQSKASSKGTSLYYARSEAATSSAAPAGKAPAEPETQMKARFSDSDAKADLQERQAVGGGAAPTEDKAKQAPNISQDYPNLNGRPVLPGRDQRVVVEPRDAYDEEGGKPQARFKSTYANVRLEVKTANLAVEVPDVPKAQLATETIAKTVKGRVQSSSKTDDEGQLATANITLRVPVATFQAAVNMVRKLGRVTGDTLNSDDVTAEVADTEARLQVLREEEKQYTALIKTTKKVSEVLEVKDKLSETRQEIESMDATRKALRGRAAESTINVELKAKRTPEQPRENASWSHDTFAEAVGSLNSVGRKVGGGLVYLYVFAPIWLPVALLSWWGLKRRTT